MAVITAKAKIFVQLFEAGTAPRLFRNVVEQRGVSHSFIIEAMRSFLSLIPALLLAGACLAQTPAPTPATKKIASKTVAKAAPPAASKNYKLTGSPAATVTVELYTDFECPSCREFFLKVLPEVEKNYIATGKIQLLHRDFRLPQHNYTKIATRYANAAGLIGQYQIVTQALFANQQEWAQNGNVDGAVAKVLSAADIEKVRNLVKTDSHLDDTAVADEAQGAKDALGETPTMVIVKNGKRTKVGGFVQYNILKAYLDQILKS